MSLIEDRSLGLVNLAIGVGGLLLALVALPAAIGYLFGQSIVIAILIGVIVGGVVLLMGGGFFFLRWHLNRPPYTLIAGEIDLRFHDPASGRATLVRTEKIQVNQSELGYIRIGRMISDGSIKNLHVDDKPIDEHQ